MKWFAWKLWRIAYAGHNPYPATRVQDADGVWKHVLWGFWWLTNEPPIREPFIDD
jgi:hypothetical protein